MKDIPWRTRDGRFILVSKMEDSHLKNLAVYLETESKQYNKEVYSLYIDQVKQEFSRRKIDFQAVIEAGTQPFTDVSGVPKLWDEETNQDMVQQ
jgi:hypothetical protein